MKGGGAKQEPSAGHMTCSLNQREADLLPAGVEKAAV